jgi:hypothetical protein
MKNEILLVEDDASLAGSLERVLVLAGYWRFGKRISRAG